MALKFPAALDAAGFLAQHWQRTPLYLPQALADFSLPDADELAGLACDDDVESRLVFSPPNRWQVQHGPFAADTFAQLPETGWTLLVQDVDKHLPDVARLLDDFSFLPRWRIDDIMISFAAPGGTVGPHVDEYDVFLLQVTGSRTWQTGPADGACLPDLPLKVLAKFDPQQSWQLQPGDMLYLPPGIAHHGLGDRECITCSIGFRAPSMAEMTLRRAEHAAGRATGRYHDEGLAPAEADDGLISQAAVARAVQQLGVSEQIDDAVVWFGSLVTENKQWLSPEPRMVDNFEQCRSRGSLLRKEPAVRMARSTCGAHGWLFVDGNCIALDQDGAELAPQLCRGAAVRVPAAAGAADLLHRLYLDGKLYFDDEL
ncbi:MAG: cupin domain-containing protein [Gammaproteobacteria bacterium]|nr:cupin domain-containing protein [Gammaproteobacteria bacterium]NNF61284.1 cupin domain-containing protein [Gammaproteobacteria bacterium]